MKVMQRLKTPIIILMVALIILVCAFALFSLVSQSTAEALTVASAYKAGGGAELWNASTSSFNPTVLNDIASKIFGGADPVTYIKENGKEDWEKWGKYSTVDDEALKNTPYYLIPATTINANVGNPDNGMVITLDGKTWMAAALTLDMSENVVLTLYLADDLGVSQFWSSSSSTRGNHAYSRSIIRNHILTNSNWSLFNTTGENGFARNYLVQPKNILYQQTESMNKRGNVLNANQFNEALSIATSNWVMLPGYLPSDTFTNPSG
ncbi:MAG: hypothetical protein K2M36_02965, partial [Clostridia bacterium]|nr:hypothetical protein [Clostridia bacterium]